MTDPSARRRLCFDGNKDGFGRVYNAASLSKQAGDHHKPSIFEVSSKYLFPDPSRPGFASGGGGAYLGVAKRLVWDLMSAVEQLEDRRDETPPRRDLAADETSLVEAGISIEETL